MTLKRLLAVVGAVLAVTDWARRHMDRSLLNGSPNRWWRMSLTDIGATLTLLRAAFDLDTTELPNVWTEDNPSVGHCHVAALLIRERHGGQIWRGHLTVIPRPDGIHYWSVVDGVTIDCTRDQYPPDFIIWNLNDATLEVLKEETKEKRDLLAERAFRDDA